MKYALLIAYDGTGYGGWQIQKNKISVQQKVEEAACGLLLKLPFRPKRLPTH